MRTVLSLACRKTAARCAAAAVAVAALVAPVTIAAQPASAANSGNTFMYAPDINTNHQLCLGISSNSNALLRHCTFVNDQAWFRGGELGTTGYYQYKNGYGKCLDVAGGSNAVGAQITAVTCTGTKHHDQYWAVDFINNQTYACFVFNYHSGYVLEPLADALYSEIKQYPWQGNGASWQEWVFAINS